MNLGPRPTFGVKSPEVKQTNTKRQEFGAAWKRQTKKENIDFLSIRLQLTKEKLKALLSSVEETVTLNLVAFPNTFKNEDDKRPDFKLYEDRE